jgi:hypothetical protein
VSQTTTVVRSMIATENTSGNSGDDPLSWQRWCFFVHLLVAMLNEKKYLFKNLISPFWDFFSSPNLNLIRGCLFPLRLQFLWG